MPAKNVEQIKIWKPAHTWLKQLSDAHKALGKSSDSMTRLASEAILAIPMPENNGHLPQANPCEEKEESIALGCGKSIKHEFSLISESGTLEDAKNFSQEKLGVSLDELPKMLEALGSPLPDQLKKLLK
jgi:hypothetical protein